MDVEEHIMNKKKWTDYDRYLVLSDKSDTKLPSTWAGFLKFKEIKINLEKIARSSGKSWLADNKYGAELNQVVLEKKITSSDAQTILTNIYDCKWTNKTNLLFRVASQLGIDLRKDN